MKKICFLIGLAAFAADQKLIPISEIELKAYFDATSDSDRADMLDALLSPNKAATSHVNFIKESEARNRLNQFNRARNDQELGGASQSQASTSLASAAGVADLVSTAVESGAIAQSSSGTATTIRLKPVSVYDLFAGRAQSPCHQFLVLSDGGNADNCAKLLDKYFGGLSAAITLDNAKPDQTLAQPAGAIDANGKTTSINATNGSVARLLTQDRTLTSWGVRYEIYNQRNARNPAFAKAWTKAVTADSLKAKGEALAAAVNNLTDTANQDSAFLSWKEITGRRLVTARLQGWEALEMVWREQLATFSLQTTKDYDKARTDFIAEENRLLKVELEKPILSVEYTNLRPLNQPDLSNIKFLISKPFQVEKMQEGMFTFNAGVDLYNSIPAGAKVGRLRDLSAALQWDVPIGQIQANMPTIFTVAAYYQYQVENGLISVGAGNLAPNTTIQLPSDAKTLLAPKGGIFIGQVKLTFKLKNGTTRVPLGISWANRTELIKAPEVRGHVGVQFDWSTLFGLNK